MTIKIVIIEDSTLVRKGLVALVKSLHAAAPANIAATSAGKSYEVIADVSSSKDLFEVLSAHTPDILLLDYSLNTQIPENHPLHAMDGHNLIKYILRHYGVKIIVVSSHHSPVIIRASIDAGAHAYISKGANEEVLEQALHAVMKGHTFIEHHLLKSIVHRNTQTTMISPKEMEVLRQLGNGNRLTDIARHMNLSIKTISAHKLRAMKKLEITSESELFQIIRKLSF